MKSRALVPLLLLALALSGCAGLWGSQAPPTGRHECFRSDASGSWEDPYLYDALPAAAARADITLIDSGVPGAMAFRHASLDDHWRTYTVSWIEWRTGNHSESYVLSSRLPGEVHVQARQVWDDDNLLATFGAFLDALGMADSPERPAWERALVASRGGGPWPQVTFVAQPRMDLLFERLGALGNATVTDERIAAVALSWQSGWTMHLQLATHHVVTETSDGRAFEMLVDERGRARAHVRIDRDDDPAATLRRSMEEVFARLGLDAPALTQVRGGLGAC